MDPNRFRFRKVVRIMGLVLKFLLLKCPSASKFKVFKHEGHDILPAVLKNVNDRFLVTNGQVNDLPCKAGSVIEVTDKILRYGWNYFVIKASNEVKKFSDNENMKTFQ